MSQPNGQTVPGPKLNVRSSPRTPLLPSGLPSILLSMTSRVLTFVQGNTFLFTSESVGEGHPDKIA